MNRFVVGFCFICLFVFFLFLIFFPNVTSVAEWDSNYWWFFLCSWLLGTRSGGVGGRGWSCAIGLSSLSCVNICKQQRGGYKATLFPRNRLVSHQLWLLTWACSCTRLSAFGRCLRVLWSTRGLLSWPHIRGWRKWFSGQPPGGRFGLN